MGLVGSLIYFFKKRRLIRRFGQYVDPAMVEQIINNPDTSTAPPVHRRLDFVLALLRDNDLDALPSHLEQIANAGYEIGGVVERLTGPLIVITFGGIIAAEMSAGQAKHRRVQLVARLQQALADNIKLLHGNCIGLEGDFGSDAVRRYGSLLPSFSEMLKTLSSLEFGQEKEWVVGASFPVA